MARRHNFDKILIFHLFACNLLKSHFDGFLNKIYNTKVIQK